MLNQNDIDIIIRYVTGQANESETNWVENLFAGGAGSPGLRKYLHEDYSKLQPETNISLTPLLDKLHHIIQLKEMQQKKSFRFRFIHNYSRVAAVLLLPVLFACLWLYFVPHYIPEQLVEQSVNSTIYAPLGSRVEFNLPDGTKGFLNSGSSLSYTIPFSNNRRVILEGEAWFDVAHDEQHQFEISAGTSTVRVLGTSFNLSAYPDEKYLTIVLAEGSLEFSATGQGNSILLQPSDRLVYNDEGIFIEKTEAAKYGGWTKGKLIFRGDNMDEVARRLERWYNVEIELADKALEDYVFRGTFEDDNLKDVLKLLSMTSRIRYQITPREQIGDDKWRKEKVTFFLRN
jgi:transmembrane sensor